MPWDAVPNFGDQNAKINERIHGDSGARIIEVLYGAHDSSGKPTTPESKADGHGHWIALEIDGMYQMLSWRRPQSAGGKQEYGRGRSSNALKDLEDDIRDKQRLCSQAEAVAVSKEWKQGSRILTALYEEWKKLYNWNTPKEKELWERFQSARDKFYKGRNDDRERNKSIKKAIIYEASNIVYSKEWKQTSDRLKALFEKWKATASAGKDDDDALWSEFNRLRQVFFDRQQKYFQEREDQREKDRRAKTEIITEARNVAQYSERWKETGDTLNALMVRWENIGSAGRDYDETLWSEFNAIRKDFFSRRSQYYEDRDRQFVNNAAAKNRIVEEAHYIARARDFPQCRQSA